jgi:hypothetical protein
MNRTRTPPGNRRVFPSIRTVPSVIRLLPSSSPRRRTLITGERPLLT